MKVPTRTLLAGAAVLALLLATAAPAMATDQPISLSLRPAGSAGAFFDLSLRPGDTRSLEVEIGNQGTATVSVRTSAADVYTIINGGFGARLRGEPRSGATTWLTYPTDVFTLAPGEIVVRPLSVRLPATVEPGQYISTLVVENDVPIAGSGGVHLDQIVRLAMTVRITVPGRLVPDLSIGTASLKTTTATSVVSVAVANTGNEHLRPTVSFALLDAEGSQVFSTSVQMDTFYAHTDTFVEVPLPTLLSAGSYTVQLMLDDALTGARASNDAIPLLVDQAAGPPPTDRPEASGLTGVNPVIGGEQGLGGSLLILAAGVAGGLGIAFLLGLVVFFLRRRRASLVAASPGFRPRGHHIRPR